MYSLFIGPDLESLVSLVRGGEALLAVAGSMRVEYSNIRVSPFKRTTSKPLAAMPNLAPSVASDC